MLRNERLLSLALVGRARVLGRVLVVLGLLEHLGLLLLIGEVVEGLREVLLEATAVDTTSPHSVDGLGLANLDEAVGMLEDGGVLE